MISQSELMLKYAFKAIDLESLVARRAAVPPEDAHRRKCTH